MNKIKNSLIKTGEKVIKSISDRDEYEWPPKCVGILYQPVRPVSFKELKGADPSKKL